MTFDIKEEFERITRAHAAMYGIDLNPRLEVKETRASSQTEYRMTGSLPSILTAITEMFARWPGQGYGTRVHEISQQQDGLYTARVSHANSCE